MTDDWDRQYNNSRRIVPADEIAYLNIVRELPRTAPQVGIYDSPTRCFRANVEWAAHICGAVASLATWTAWEGAEDDRDPAVQAILEFLRGTDCGMYQLRQSPADSCVLEQSGDGGITWTVAFNFRWCMPSFSPPSIAESSVNVANYGTWIQNTGTIWNGVITNIAPNSVMDSGPNDVLRNQAMCYAVSMLVASLGKAASEEYGSNDIDWNSIIKIAAIAVDAAGSLALGLAGAGTIALSPPVAVGVAVAIAVSSFVLAVLPDGQELDIRSVLEPRIQKELICCAMGVLEGVTPDPATFATIFDSCSIAGADDDVMALLQYMVDQEDTYLTFLQVINQAYDALAAGQVFICPDCSTWCVLHDFQGAISHGWAPGGEDPAGTLIPSGWQHTDIVIGTGEARRAVMIEKSFASRVVTKIEVLCDYWIDAFENNTRAIIFETFLGAVRTDALTFYRDTAPQGNQLRVTWEDPNGIEMDKVVIFFRASKDSTVPYNYGNGQVIVRSVEICGQGTQPTGL